MFLMLAFLGFAQKNKQKMMQKEFLLRKKLWYTNFATNQLKKAFFNGRLGNKFKTFLD